MSWKNDKNRHGLAARGANVRNTKVPRLEWKYPYADSNMLIHYSKFDKKTYKYLISKLNKTVSGKVKDLYGFPDNDIVYIIRTKNNRMYLLIFNYATLLDKFAIDRFYKDYTYEERKKIFIEYAKKHDIDLDSSLNRFYYYELMNKAMHRGGNYYFMKHLMGILSGFEHEYFSDRFKDYTDVAPIYEKEMKKLIKLYNKDRRLTTDELMKQLLTNEFQMMLYRIDNSDMYKFGEYLMDEVYHVKKDKHGYYHIPLKKKDLKWDKVEAI